eukprot:gene21780-26199_t
MVLITGVVMLSIGFGVLNIQIEDDVLRLWVDDQTSVIDQLDFAKENFPSARFGSLICRPKSGKTLLAKQAWEEVMALQEWIRTVRYVHKGQGYTLDNFCFKAVDSKPEYACFVFSPLDCFQEGRYFAPGGENNTAVWSPYATRNSFRNADYDFSTNLTLDYLKSSCRLWLNMKTPYQMMYGGVVPGKSSADPISELAALRITFATLTPESLVTAGLDNVTWEATEESVVVHDELGCPSGGPYDSETEYCGCALSYDIFEAVKYGCTPSPVPQSRQCCNYAQRVLDHPCFPHLLTKDSTLSAIGKIVAQQCSLKLPPIPQPRCQYFWQDGSTTTTLTNFTPPPKWSSMVSEGQSTQSTESCVDDRAYTETLNLPSGPVQLECAGVPTLLSTVQVTECSAVAGRLSQLGMAEIFT